MPTRASTLMKVKAVQSTSDFRFSNERVNHAGLCALLEYGVGSSSLRKKPRRVALRSSAIPWFEFIKESLGWRSSTMEAVSGLFLLIWAKNRVVLAEFASSHSCERRSAHRIHLDRRCSCWRQSQVASHELFSKFFQASRRRWIAFFARSV